MSVHLEAPMGVNRRASTISVVTRAPASEATHWTLTGDGVTVSQKRKILADILTYILTDRLTNGLKDRQTNIQANRQTKRETHSSGDTVAVHLTLSI